MDTTTTTHEALGASVDDAAQRLAAAGYVPSPEIATVTWLATQLERPLLVEGPAGVGKTSIAAALARVSGRPLIRLQCYEGLDEAKALYEWEYAKQLLYTQLVRDQVSARLADATSIEEAMEIIAADESAFFHERFLLPRPLLQAIREPHGAILLIDEIDKADAEFEAFLLELLSDFQVTIPELGTFHAEVRPWVVLTSNRARELSEALKRRCLHLYIDFPDQAREREIVATHLPELPDQLNAALVAFVQGVRELDLRKLPSISESIDWARALLVLGAERLDPRLVQETLGALLKYEEDRDLVSERLDELPGLAPQ
ncbi:MAG: MoxR family ATPase [Candidatus Dadabacteria bacterium]|nr:MAG: MoxR family ATPase [Candidatus Dadabacteria bacterium]